MRRWLGEVVVAPFKSALGTKRTCVISHLTSAFDPKQTFGRLSPVRIRLGINCPFRTTLTPNSIFSDADMPPVVAAATIQLWQSGTLSKRTTHQKLAKGRLRTLIGISTPVGRDRPEGPIWEQP